MFIRALRAHVGRDVRMIPIQPCNAVEATLTLDLSSAAKLILITNSIAECEVSCWRFDLTDKMAAKIL